MNRIGEIAFLSLVFAQAAHSVEGYTAGVYEILPPARFASSLLSRDLATGFAFLSALLVGFGLWCWSVPVRFQWSIASALVWSWAVIGLGNGLSHLVVAMCRGGCFPGLATASLLVAVAAWLVVVLARGNTPASVAA
jgi:hypothetical protein